MFESVVVFLLGTVVVPLLFVLVDYGGIIAHMLSFVNTYCINSILTPRVYVIYTAV
jgi:hypothetical protein